MALGEQFRNTYWFEDPYASDESEVDPSKLSVSLVRSTPFSDPTVGTEFDQRRAIFPTQSATIERGLRDTGVFEPKVSTVLNDLFGGRPETHTTVETLPNGEETIKWGMPGRDAEETPYLQGMLFSPYTATGLKEDPLVPEGAREDAARRALGMTDTNEYIQRVAKRLKTNVGQRAAEAHQDLAVDALVRAPMPIQEIERMAELGSAHTVVNPKSGRAFFDSGFGNGGQIVVNRDTKRVKQVTKVPDTTEIVTTPGEHLANTKFWGWFDKTAPKSGTMAFFEDLVDTSRKPESGIVWSHPETGEVLDLSDLDTLSSHPMFSASENDDLDISTAKNKALHTVRDLNNKSYKSLGRADHLLKVLRSGGYVPNLYSGKDAKLKDPVHTSSHSFWGDFSSATGPNASEYNTIRMHTRHAPGTLEERVVPGHSKVSYKNVPILSGESTTLVHEMGHAKDTKRIGGQDRWHHLANVHVIKPPNRSNPYERVESYGFGDPIAEGVADGYADMYGNRRTNLLQSAIEDPTFASTHFKSTGYSTGYSGFKTNTHRAVYAAVRAHVGSGGDFDQVPDRSVIKDMPELRMEHRMREAENAGGRNDSEVRMSHVLHEATLGHMWETMPHVRGHLTELGYDRIAMKAAEENQRHKDTWNTENNPQPEQLSIPFS